MSFLTDNEIDTIEVSKMILHVVGRNDEPFNREPEIEVQQEQFFRERILRAAASGLHTFEPDSQIKPIVESIAQGNMLFEAGGQELARLFYRDHVKQSTSGAFFVFELRCNDPQVKFYALVKYDYREAVELSQVDGQSVLRAIVQAFIKERRAVQKFCLIRVRNGVSEDLVSASDRMKEAPDLTDYFERYLGVTRSRSTQELSRKLNEVLRSTMQDIKDVLPDGNIGGAIGRAKQALAGRHTVTNEDVVDSILHAVDRPEDEEIQSRIERVTRRKLKTADLTDVDFRPDGNIFRRQPRQFLKTSEQVRLEYPGEELNRSVFRRVLPGGGEEITVRTNQPLVEDGTLADKSRD